MNHAASIADTTDHVSPLETPLFRGPDYWSAAFALTIPNREPMRSSGFIPVHARHQPSQPFRAMLIAGGEDDVLSPENDERTQ